MELFKETPAETAVEVKKAKVEPIVDKAKDVQTIEVAENKAVTVAEATPLKLDSPNAIRGFLGRNFRSRGDLPQQVFDTKVATEGWYNSQLKDISFTTKDFNRAVKKDFGRNPSKEQIEVINEALQGNTLIMNELPEATRSVVKSMRDQIDVLSEKMIDEGVIQGDMIPVFEANKGFYTTRSYKVHSDPKWAEKVDPQIREKAKALLREEYPNKTSIEIDALIEAMLYEGKAADSPIALIKRGNLGSKDLSILKKRTGIAPEIRALFGERTDPLANYAISVSKMSNLIANHRFLETVKNEGLGNTFFPEPTIKDGVAYKARISADNSQAMYPLNGFYTTPEIKTAFEKALGPSQSPPLLRQYMKVNGVVKLSKTVGSLVTHIRNTLSFVGFSVANGHWRVGKLGKAAKVTGTELIPGTTPWQAMTDKFAKLDKAEHRAEIKKLTELGVLDESAIAGEFMDIIKDASKQTLDQFTDNYVKRQFVEGTNVVKKVYMAEDNIRKVYAFENEKARYQKAYPDMPIAEIEKIAADVVRATDPTYSLVAPGIKEIRRFPLVGPFVSFPAEVFRTSKNIILQIQKDLANPATRFIGMERLVGTLMAASGTAAIATASRHINGVSNKQDEDMRRFLPHWSQNSQLFYLGQNEKGQMMVVDMSYVDPYEYVKKPITAFIRGEDWEEAAVQAAVEAGSPFLSEEILLKAIREIASNKKEGGTEVFSEVAEPIDQMLARVEHILKALEPGTISSIRRVAQGLDGFVTPSGIARDPKIEAIATMTGQRVVVMDIPRSFSFRSGDFADDYRDASKIFRSKAGSAGTKTVEDINKAHDEMEASRKRLFAEFSKDIGSAARLQVPFDQIEQIMKDAGISETNRKALLGGEYLPYLATIGKTTINNLVDDLINRGQLRPQ